MSQPLPTPKRSIVLLPETGGKVHCVAYRGVITPQDYRDYMDTPLRAIAERHGKFRLLVHFTPDFVGWEKDAADINFKSINEFGHLSERLAYVNPPERKVLQMTLQKSQWQAPVRYFDDAELPNALEWISQN